MQEIQESVLAGSNSQRRIAFGMVLGLPSDQTPCLLLKRLLLFKTPLIFELFATTNSPNKVHSPPYLLPFPSPQILLIGIPHPQTVSPLTGYSFDPTSTRGSRGGLQGGKHQIRVGAASLLL